MLLKVEGIVDLVLSDDRLVVYRYIPEVIAYVYRILTTAIKKQHYIKNGLICRCSKSIRHILLITDKVIN